jgi:cytochrome c-type biogenesis protein CcmH/NrfF
MPAPELTIGTHLLLWVFPLVLVVVALVLHFRRRR